MCRRRARTSPSTAGSRASCRPATPPPRPRCPRSSPSRLSRSGRIGATASASRLVSVSRILVGYDGSDGGKRALERAASEARSSHAKITVLSVLPMPLDPDVPRNFGTLDDISDREGGPHGPPPDVVAHLNEARDLL